MHCTNVIWNIFLQQCWIFCLCTWINAIAVKLFPQWCIFYKNQFYTKNLAIYGKLAIAVGIMSSNKWMAKTWVVSKNDCNFLIKRKVVHYFFNLSVGITTPYHRYNKCARLWQQICQMYWWWLSLASTSPISMFWLGEAWGTF